MSRRFALYPRLTAGYEAVRTTDGSLAASHDGPWGSVDVVVLFSPVPHFFAGVVPSLTVDAGNAGGPEQGGANVAGGAGFLVGGWFGGAEPDGPIAPEEVDPEAPRPKQFGDEGVWVLNAELAAYGYDTLYTGAVGQPSYVRYGVAAGADYFVVPRFSLGGSLSGAHASVRSTNLGGTPYSNDIGRTGGTVRAGVDLPLGRWLSFYPRLSLGYGVENFQYAYAAAVNAGSDDYFFVDLSAPLLVHPARHFFVGFGPEASTDLTRTYTPRDTNNKSTFVGAGLTVGGWL